MRKTLREEILSVNIKKDNTYDEILDIIDDYCHKNHKNTSIRFAIGFYYLFIAAVERGSLLCDDGLGLASDIFILLYPEITVRTSSQYPYINTFLHVTNMYIDPMGWWARRLKSEKYIMYHIDLPHMKVALAFCNAAFGFDRYVDKDGDILFMSNKFREVTSKYCDIYYNSSTATNKLLPAVVT